ncbi:MAG: hypothetical protein AAF356_04830 [Planctomycetota bacterium]
MTPRKDARPPAPRTPSDAMRRSAGQPAGLTFFLSRGERRDALRALRAHHADRREALLIALGLAPRPTDRSPDA